MHNLELLKHWNTAGQQMEQAFAKYEDVTHTPSDAPHLDRARNAMHQYTVLVAKTTGIPFDALYDWWTACEFGRTDLVVRKGSGDFQSLRSIEQVYEFYSALDKTEWPCESRIDTNGNDGLHYV